MNEHERGSLSHKKHWKIFKNGKKFISKISYVCICIRSKSEREAKDNLEKDGGEGKKQGGVEELGSSQSSSTKQGVLVGKRDGLMRLLARQELMMMMMMHM